MSRTTSDFYVASRSGGPGLNASAISGEYLSAASFLGIAGAIATVECRRIMTVPKPKATGMVKAISAPLAEPPAPGPDTMKPTPPTVTAIATQV